MIVAFRGRGLIFPAFYSEEGSEEEEDEDEGEGDYDEEDYMNEEDEAFMNNITDEPGKDSGCTAVVALLHEKDLYVANAGKICD